MIEEEHSKGLRRGFDKVSPLFVPMSISNMRAGMAGHRVRIQRKLSMYSDGLRVCYQRCGRSFQTSQRRISGRDDDRRKRKLYIRAWDRRIHFHEGSLRVKHTGRASIPFDKERSGFVMGEGAGVIFWRNMNTR